MKALLAITPRLQHQIPGKLSALCHYLKSLIKKVFIEVLSERPELLMNALGDALEDRALANAIEEGDGSGNVSRDEVFAVLRGAS